MAEWFDKLKNAVMGEPDDYEDEYDEEYDDYDDYESEESGGKVRDFISFKNFSRNKRPAQEGPSYSSFRGQAAATRGYGGNVVRINTNVNMQVVVAQPTSLEDASAACEDLKDRKIVLVNLEGLGRDEAQRITDFFSGACYALEGSIQPVSNRIFIIGPEYVNITGQFKEELAASGIKLPNSSIWNK